MSTPPKPPRPIGPQAFDIFHPSRVKPQSTSRPVIVSNKPEQDDPMVLKQNEPAMSPEPATAPTVPSQPVISEPAVSPVPEEEVATPISQPVGGSIPVGPPEVADAVEVTEPHTEPVEKPVRAENVESIAEQQVPSSESQNAHTDLGNHLEGIDDRNRLLPWNEVTSAATEKPIISIHAHRKGSRLVSWVLTFVTILAILAAGADFALDAGWISVSGVPHTHFIKK